jgi:hypothetical protein
LSTFAGNSTEGASLTDFYPRAELNIEDADMTLLFLSNQAVYTEKVDDLWFKASSQSDSRGLEEDLYTNYESVWWPDRLISTLGCTERYQFCNGQRCSALSGLDTIDPSKDNSLGFNAKQTAVFKTLWKAAWGMRIFFIPFLLGSNFLLAQQFIQGAEGGHVSSSVYSDQWIKEVENIHNISLAVLQRRIVEYASPPSVLVRPGVSSLEFIVPAETEELNRICGMIKVRSAVYSSFSVFGLFTILITGFLFILTNLFISDIIFWFRRRRKTDINECKRREWIESQFFQLQRSAFEGRHIGPWEDINEDIPVTTDIGKVFPSLPNLSKSNTS